MVRLLILVGSALLAAGATAAGPPVYGDGRHVRDEAGILDPATQARLAGRLDDAEARYGPQVGIVTVNSLEGKTIAQFSVDYAKQWGLGRQRDDGVIIVVAPMDHQALISTTVGLVPNYPRAWCQEVLDKALLPQFHQGRYGQGLENAVTLIVEQMKHNPTFKVYRAHSGAEPA